MFLKFYIKISQNVLTICISFCIFVYVHKTNRRKAKETNNAKKNRPSNR